MWWIEILKSLPGLVTAGAAVVGACVAYQGLQKWRQETVGKRKMELAEDVLADFYEARDIINHARSPAAFGGEGSTRPKREGEDDEDTRTRDAYYVAVERLFKRSEFFARLDARQYRFIAHFGKQAAAPYQQLREIRAAIIASAHTLIRMHKNPTPSVQFNMKQWENTRWASPDDDTTAMRAPR